MFEIIETQQIFNKTYYKAKTSQGISWYYFKGTEIKKLVHLKYNKNSSYRMIKPIFGLCADDWKDVNKFIETLN